MSVKNHCVISTADSETKKIAQKLALEIFRARPGKHAVIVNLIGELGSGKTTFAKGFAKGLGIKQIIQSPTFIIARRYSLKSEFHKNFYHIDAYRIGSKDLLTLGWRGWVKNPANIILVEWADRINRILPKNSSKIIFETLKNGKRKITFQ